MTISAQPTTPKRRPRKFRWTSLPQRVGWRRLAALVLARGWVNGRRSRLFLPNNEVDHSIRRGDEKTIEILAQLFHLIAPWNPIDFQERRGGFGVVFFHPPPNVGVTQVWHQIHPKPVRSELKDATIRFLFDQGQCQGIAIERHGLFIRMGRTFNRDIGPAGELRPMNVRYHDAEMVNPRPLDATSSSRPHLIGRTRTVVFQLFG